ncbi:MAG: poly(3-hydroxybutyrate) depolymerase [Saprospiraceae bacterium]|jgi:poly(3-hydroxybutyrate) depolymerase
MFLFSGIGISAETDTSIENRHTHLSSNELVNGAPESEIERAMAVDGRNRIYHLHIPDNLPKQAPLVIALHGYGGSAKGTMDYSGLNEIANKNRFAVCYPQGVYGKDEKNSWNAGYSNLDVNDVKYVTKLTVHLQETHSLSESNTFIVGISNGGDMSYLLACQRPDMYRAIAPIVGCMMESTYDGCNNIRPVSILHVHGTADKITEWDGDMDYFIKSKGYRSVHNTFDYWSRKNGGTNISIDTLADSNSADDHLLILEKRDNRLTDHRVWLYTLVGAYHDWSNQPGFDNFHVMEEVWDFFEAALVTTNKTNVSFFGSSVCKGSGATDTKGYAYQFYHSGSIDTLRYAYFNPSTGGDNTLKVAQEKRLTHKLYPTDPDIAVIGLSLGNEGIRTPQTEDGRARVLEQYRSRLKALADSLDRLGIQPIIANCYAHSYFTGPQYEATKRMNQIINTWNYPSINLLGTIDDGIGRWVEGYVNDPWHPNTEGHHEMSLAIVPSLFDAIANGKKIPRYDYNKSYINISNASQQNVITHDVVHKMHSFTMSFRFKSTSNGAIAIIDTDKGKREIIIDDYKISYLDNIVTFPKHSEEWSHVVVSHNHARQKTLIAINGQVVAEVSEQLIPSQFVFGGTLESVDLKDLMLHRASLHTDEISDLNNKLFIQSSLEIYAPLTSKPDIQGPRNLAQSMSQLEGGKEVDLKWIENDYYKRR